MSPRLRWRVRLFVYGLFAVGALWLGCFSAHPAIAQSAPPLVDPNFTAAPQQTLFQVNPGGAQLPAADVTFSGLTDALSGVQAQMITYAERLFILLVGLDAFWMTAQFLLTRENLGEFLAQLATKIMTVTFVFYVVIMHGNDLATVIIGSFNVAATNAGNTINSNNSGSFTAGTTPTGILALGTAAAAVGIAEAAILDAIPDEILGNGSTNDTKAESEILTGASLAIFGVYAGIAAEVAVATLEIYVVLNLGIIVTGFLGSRWSERYGQGFVSFAIHAGIKFMFVQIILGLIQPVLVTAGLVTMIIPVVGPAAFAAVALVCAAILHAVPNFAASAMSGQSNSSGSQLAGALSQAMGSAGSMVKMASGAVKNDLTKDINREAKEKSAASESKKEQAEMAGFANRAMMREEAGDQRRQRSFEEAATAQGASGLQIGGQRSAGVWKSGAVPGGGANGASLANGTSAAKSPAARMPSGANAPSALGAANGKAASAAAAAKPPGAASAQASINAASAAGVPKPLTGGSVAKGPLAPPAATPPTAFSPGAVPAASAALQPSSASRDDASAMPTPLAAASIPSLGTTGTASAPVSTGSSSAGGASAAPSGDGTLGGFVMPTLADALTAAPPAAVGIGPQPFDALPPVITPLGASTQAPEAAPPATPPLAVPAPTSLGASSSGATPAMPLVPASSQTSGTSAGGAPSTPSGTNATTSGGASAASSSPGTTTAGVSPTIRQGVPPAPSAQVPSFGTAPGPAPTVAPAAVRSTSPPGPAPQPSAPAPTQKPSAPSRSATASPAQERAAAPAGTNQPRIDPVPDTNAAKVPPQRPSATSTQRDT